jgi:hypothetical protein
MSSGQLGGTNILREAVLANEVQDDRRQRT